VFIEQNDITWKKLGTSIPTYMINRVIGSTALENIEKFDKLKIRNL
jgi:hypothetical protein